MDWIASQGRPVSRSDLAAAFDVHPATIHRHIRRAAGQGDVAIWRRGPSARYLRRAPLFGMRAEPVPLYAIDASGGARQVASLTGCAGGDILIQEAVWNWLDGENDGLFADLPYYLQDICPQGFLGRRIARESAVYPDRLEDWTGQDLGRYLLTDGAHLPGNLVLGDEALAVAGESPPAVGLADYPALAEEALSLGVPGSSAGGEQPKFLCFRDGRHVLVKFSPRDAGPVAERWRDLLVCEHLALSVLDAYGIPAARSRLHEADGRLFLESERFDRVGRYGRRPVVSLSALNAEFGVVHQDWPRVLEGLSAGISLAPDVVAQGALLDAFGAWIENSDRHLGNLALWMPVRDGETPTLAPVYDMLPMGHAPVGGEVRPSGRWRPPVRRAIVDAEHWRQAAEMARLFWQRVADDSRISRAFRQIAALRENDMTDYLEMGSAAEAGHNRDSSRPGMSP